MNAIVAVTQDWGIGYQGKLLIHDGTDMRHFVRHTKGATVVMGRRTLESFPGGRPLANRRNVVLTSDPDFTLVPPTPETSCAVAHSLEEVFRLVSPDDLERVWVIGGDQVYRQLLPYCTHAVVTRFQTILPADTYFPNLDADDRWVLEGVEEGGLTEDEVAFDFATYANREPQSMTMV